MGWIHLFLIGLFMISPSLSAEESIRLTNGEWPPYLSQNLPHHGFASHLVTEVFSAVGVNVEYGFFPWKRSFVYAKKGSAYKKVWHGSLVWVYTKKRAKDFLYTDVVISDREVLFHLKSHPVVWQRLTDLKGKKIGGTLHTVYPIFEQAEKQGILKIERAGNYDTLFKRLLAKRIDAVPQVHNVGNYFIRTKLTPEEQAQIAFAPTIIQERKYHVILTKHRRENKRYSELLAPKGAELLKSGLSTKLLLF